MKNCPTRDTVVALIFVTPLLSLLAGCPSSGPGASCRENSDCPEGQICVGGACVEVDAGIGDGGVGFDGSHACLNGDPCGAEEWCCHSSESCNGTRCTPSGSCESSNDCSDDTYCSDQQCIAWDDGQYAPDCVVNAVPGLLIPVAQCTWGELADTMGKSPDHRNVLGTPVVVDFDYDGNAATHAPSIAFVTYNGNDGSPTSEDCSSTLYGVIRVIDGATCKLQHSLDAVRVRPASPLAVGDLNGDGRPEIVAARCGGGLVALTYNEQAGDFQLLWTSQPSDFAPTGSGSAGPALHDLDDDGKPEVLWWGTVWRGTDGALLDGTLSQLSYASGYFAVAADVDADGKVELVDGDRIWEWRDGAWHEQTVDQHNARGQVALADFGTYGEDPAQDQRGTLDGVPEIAVVSMGKARVQTLSGRIVFGEVDLPGGGRGGPPTVGDFDADGRVELATAGLNGYTVFDPDCTGTPDKSTCDSLATDGVLWTKTSQDQSSDVTGSSIFDFEGDGAAEAIYADECFVRVYEGKTGEVVYSQWRSSCTWDENPIVADVDADANSELVVPANNNCGQEASDPDYHCRTNPLHDRDEARDLTLDPLFKGLRCNVAADCPAGGMCDTGFCRCTSDEQCGGGGFVCTTPKEGTPGSGGKVCRAAYMGRIQGIRVYRDAQNRWVGSRRIWNQHAYAVTNVDENGVVPRTSEWKPNWSQPGLNNFRQNVQGELGAGAAIDLTAVRNSEQICDPNGQRTLSASLCNRGPKPAPAGLPLTFYDGIITANRRLCTAKTTGVLEPGACTDLSCDPPTPVAWETDLRAVADDDGTGEGGTIECREGNNTALLPAVACVSLY